MTEYRRTRLDAEGQRCYRTILEAAQRQRAEVNCGPIDPQKAMDIYMDVLHEHVELFYMPSEVTAVEQSDGRVGSTVMLTMTPLYSTREIADTQRCLDQIRANVRKQVTSALSEADRIALAADYITGHATYAIDYTYNQNAASALCFGRAQCTGIAHAFKWFMDDMGVFCLVIEGTASDGQGGGPHAWNLVRLGSEYYHVDVTGMLCSNHAAGMKQAPFVRLFLLCDDAKMTSHRYTWDRSLYPACRDSSRMMHDTGPRYVNAPAGAQRQSAQPAQPAQPAPKRSWNPFARSTPTPTQTQRPAPTQTQRPVPTQTQRPAPTQTQRPAPTQTQRPAPTQTQRPAPTQTQRPAPTPAPAPAKKPGAHYANIEAFKRALAVLLRQRGTAMRFYLDNAGSNPNQVGQAIGDAAQAVGQSERVGFGMSMSIDGDMYITLTIQYM